ncbi:unnamed protein product [Cuscuta europaea]|uniref:Peptidase C1A papain C-terminal domain-containing protein n=1 Tax=Cuscuta europaea TaxID=41803 RepID=A0A9P0Z0H5_CUSEU|nr:unnamed protein product [Cuscuta europaea]
MDGETEKVDDNKLKEWVYKQPIVGVLPSTKEFGLLGDIHATSHPKAGKARSQIQSREHAVLIKGYGNIGKHKYRTIQNSYGTDWCDGGHGKVIREMPGKQSIFSSAWYPEDFIVEWAAKRSKMGRRKMQK